MTIQVPNPRQAGAAEPTPVISATAAQALRDMNISYETAGALAELQPAFAPLPEAIAGGPEAGS